MDELMERYTALAHIAEIPADYCRQLNDMAGEFEAAGRLSMAATCRKRAEYYQYKITETHHIACGGEPVPYVTVSRPETLPCGHDISEAVEGVGCGACADAARMKDYQEGTAI